MMKLIAGLSLALGLTIGTLLPADYVAATAAETAVTTVVSAELEEAIAANNAAGEKVAAVNTAIVDMANTKQCDDEAIYEKYCRATEPAQYAAALAKIAEFDVLAGDEADAIKNLNKSTKLLGVAEARLLEVLTLLQAYEPKPLTPDV